MTMVYILTWALSLLSSAAIWFGLTRRNRSQDQPQVITPVTLSPQKVRKSRLFTGRYQGRLDRSPFYACMMWSLFVGGFIMLVGGPTHPSTIDAMDPTMQRAMSAVLCLGTGVCIVGFSSATRYFRPNADLRDCYRLAVIATPANVSTLAVYAIAVGNTVHWNLRLFGLGAGGILAVLIAHLLMAADLHHEVKRLDERVAAALQAATDRVARDDQIDY
jgi:hypothetical protein